MSTSVFSAMCSALANLRFAIQLANLDADDVEVVIKLKGRAASHRLNAALLVDQVVTLPHPGYVDPKRASASLPYEDRLFPKAHQSGKIMGFLLTLEEKE